MDATRVDDRDTHVMVRIDVHARRGRLAAGVDAIRTHVEQAEAYADSNPVRSGLRAASSPQSAHEQVRYGETRRALVSRLDRGGNSDVSELGPQHVVAVSRTAHQRVVSLLGGLGQHDVL